MISVTEVFDARNHVGFSAWRKDVLCKNPYTFIIENDGVIVLPSIGIGNMCGYATKEEADKARKQASCHWIDLLIDKVYLVLKNNDFTEGRGPMLPHKLFKKLVMHIAIS